MEFYVSSFIALTAPDPEDGERREVLRYQAAYQLPRGNRFFHDHIFDDQRFAEIFIAKIRIAIKNGRKLDEKHWTEGDPMYGSDAYAAGGDQGLWKSALVKKLAKDFIFILTVVGYDSTPWNILRHNDCGDLDQPKMASGSLSRLA